MPGWGMPANVQRVIDPASGEPGEGFPIETDVQLESKTADASKRGALPVEERLAIVRRAASLLRARSEELSHLMTHEMGKPIEQSRAEISKCALCCDHYVEHAAGYLAPELIETGAHRSYVAYQPIGVSFAIM